MERKDYDRERLLRLVMSMGLRREDAEDVVQTTVLAAYKAGELAPSNYYLAKAARREAARLSKKRRRETTTELREEQGYPELERQAWARHVDHIDQVLGQVEFERIINMVPVRWRLVVHRRMMGEALSDIAAELGINANTARSWLSRGLKDLRDHLELEWEAVETGIALSSIRIVRIGEIAGVSVELVKHQLLETDYNNADQHAAWLKKASDATIADGVREIIRPLLPPDSLDEEVEE